MYRMEPVGFIRNKCTDPGKVPEMKGMESVIEIHEPYVTGLFMTETAGYLDVVFLFHLSESPGHGEADWRLTTLSGEHKGVFASRSPNRPNPIGVTTVKVIERTGNRLRVTGLDAVDGTPVLDIKACDTSLFENNEIEKVHTDVLKSNPRLLVWKHIRAGDTEQLLLQAGQMHGHYCPGLAMGVMAATRAMQMMGTDSDGLEDLLAIVETNNCLSDGVQLVTGCSFGNNSLIFHDVGKMAFTLTKRDGKGIRFISRPESRSLISDAFPDFDQRYHRVVVKQNRDPEEVAAYRKSGIERAFGTLSLDVDRLFETKRVEVTVPDYAPSYADEVCSICGEQVMAKRVVESDGKKRCIPCSGRKMPVIDGYGIHHSADAGNHMSS